jgi:hypothetical protein
VLGRLAEEPRKSAATGGGKDNASRPCEKSAMQLATESCASATSEAQDRQSLWRLPLAMRKKCEIGGEQGGERGGERAA